MSSDVNEKTCPMHILNIKGADQPAHVCGLISTFVVRCLNSTIARGATEDDFSGRFFRIFEIIIFCFVVAICDLVHDVETIFHLSYVLTASGNLF